MGYRHLLQQKQEMVQDLEVAAPRRLDEAAALFISGRHHSAIYLAGLAAEMYLKTACFFVRGAQPGDLLDAHLGPVKHKTYKPPFKMDFESGHGLWFWSQELVARRKQSGKRTPNRFFQVLAALYNDWFVGMRYRPGMATIDDAAVFITNVEWIANNHALLRR